MKTVICIGEFLVSTSGIVCALVLRTLLAAFFICSGIQMFDFKKSLAKMHIFKVICFKLVFVEKP